MALIFTPGAAAAGPEYARPVIQSRVIGDQGDVSALKPLEAFLLQTSSPVMTFGCQSWFWPSPAARSLAQSPAPAPFFLPIEVSVVSPFAFFWMVQFFIQLRRR
jgi:hypothetical protein